MKIKEENKNRLKALEKAKIGALLVPVVSSIILLINVFKGLIPPYIGNVDENTTVVVNQIMSDDSNINFGLTILGIAVTVWIGLSIYNAIEKKEVDEVKELYKELKEEQEYTEALNEWLCNYHSKMVSLRDFINEEDTKAIEFYLKNHPDCISSFNALLNTNQDKSKKWLNLQFDLLEKYLYWYVELHRTTSEYFEQDTYELLREITKIISEEISLYYKATEKDIKEAWFKELAMQKEKIEKIRDNYFEYEQSNEFIKQDFEKLLDNFNKIIQITE